MRRTICFCLLLAAVALATVGCRRTAPQNPAGGQTADSPKEIEILCGGSFRPPLEELAGQFEEQTGVRAVLVFGQSEDHLPKVKEHTIGDLFVSHDPFIKYTEDADAMLRYITVGYVAPVLVVAEGNPKDLKHFDDLAKPDLRVVLPNPDFSTCGQMVFALLDKKDEQQPGFKEAVLRNTGNALMKTHAQTATQIKLGHRDAGIMWNGVAHNWLDALDIVPAPYEYDEEVRVCVMGLSFSKKKDLVEKFLDFCETHGKQIFTQYGYVK